MLYSHLFSSQLSFTAPLVTGLDYYTCLLVFMGSVGSWIRADGNFHLLAQQDK